MKGIIKLIAQVLTIVIIGVLLAILRQNSRSWYYAVLIPGIAFLSLMTISLSVAFFGDDLTAGGPVKKLIMNNVVYFLFLFFLLFISCDRAISIVQIEIFDLRAKVKSKWYQLAGGIILICAFTVLFSVVSERVVFFTVTFVLVYLLWKSVNTENNKNEVLSDDELFHRAMSIGHFKSLYFESGVSKEEFISTLRSIYSSRENKTFLKSMSRQRAKY